MGDTPAPARIRSSNDVLDLVLRFVDAVIGDEAFLVVGHSAGGYLARGIAHRRPQQVAGLALMCPLMSDAELGDHRPAEAAEDLGVELTSEQEEAFRDYFVVQTPATTRRFLSAVAPVLGRFDAESLERIGANWELDPSPESGPPYDKPTIIVTGRRHGRRLSHSMAAHGPLPAGQFRDPRAGWTALPHEQPRSSKYSLKRGSTRSIRRSDPGRQPPAP